MNAPLPICRRAVVAIAVTMLLVPSGCVRRRLAVRSNPPGALVFVDNQQIGTTPCSVDFTYYGTREIRLVKPGYETLTVNQPIPMPWYQIPPIDFVSENLVPNGIVDHRTVAFNLEPQVIVPTEQLIERGNELRQATLQTALGPAAVVPGAPMTIAPTTVAPTGPPSFGPPPIGTPLPSTIPGPTPTPLPPVMQSSPPNTFAPNPYSPTTPYSPPAAPVTPYGTPSISPGMTSPPSTVPFSAPTIPAAPPASSQQGPKIVSPPLR